jgi:hypothetical protein
VKFSDLLGEPEPDDEPAAPPAERSGAPAEPDPITVFAPLPEVSPNRPPPPVPFEPDVDAAIPAVPPVPPAPVEPIAPVAPIPPLEADATIPAMPPVPPPVNPPLDPVLDAPPRDPVLDVAPLDPVLDAPPPDPSFTPAGAGRSDLASLNIHQPAPAPEPPHSSVLDQLAGLDEVVDDLLPPRRNRK